MAKPRRPTKQERAARINHQEQLQGEASSKPPARRKRRETYSEKILRWEAEGRKAAAEMGKRLAPLLRITAKERGRVLD